MKALQDKRIIVTGGASGIGLSAVKCFLQAGARVGIADLNKKKADEASESFETESVVSIGVDVSNADSVQAMIASAVSAFGGMDGMFNNAGIILPGDGDITDTENSIWDKTLAVNLKGVFLCCRYGIPAMLASGGGSIVNNASVVGILGSYPSQIAYTASKGGVISLTREVAVCYARRGIRANTVCPGITQTTMLDGIADGDTGQDDDKRLQHIPAGRAASPEEIAQTVSFLLSDAASYITAQNWLVDGGMTGAYLCPPFPDEAV
jgi:NAD(P)-dependent dehydrogenase (short-subunit alcohol dehydrogenase family)